MRNNVDILYSDHPPNHPRPLTHADFAARSQEHSPISPNRMYFSVYLSSYCPKSSSSSSIWFHPPSYAPDVPPHEVARTPFMLHEEIAMIVYDPAAHHTRGMGRIAQTDITTVIRSHDANTTKQRTEQQRRRPHPLQYSRSVTVQSAKPAVSSQKQRLLQHHPTRRMSSGLRLCRLRCS